jgi:CubicO group peptidase (beta-lactamase class C family)
VAALDLIDSWDVPAAAAAVVSAEGVVASHGEVGLHQRWASVTKLFTTYAALLAAHRGLLDLDEPAGPPGSTVRHLLAHASGLPFEGPDPIARPATKRIYSNTGMDLVGELVAARAGSDYRRFLAEGVLAPLGIDATLEGRPSEGLVGALAGLAEFGRELLDPRLIDRGLLDEATATAYPQLGGILPGLGRFYPLPWGLGFEVKGEKQPHWTGSNNSPATFGHFGGAGSFLWVDRTAGLSLAVLTGREFGPWALEAWPGLSDAVLADYA